jgi:hypothetical protein
VTITEPIAEQAADGDVQALFEEARRRRRRRRCRVAAACVAGALLVAGLAVAFGRAGSGETQISTGSPQFADSVASATKGAGSADVSLVLRTTFLASVRGCRTPTIQGSGIIGFTNNSIELHLTKGVDSCGTAFAMQERQIGKVLYQTDPSLPRGVLTSPGRPWLKTPWSTPSALPVYGQGGVFGGTTAGFVFTALRALRGPVTRIGTGSLHGVITMGYGATITLRQLQLASRAQARSSGVTFEDLTVSANSLPPAVDIAISVVVWIDSSSRIRQLQVTEPVYALDYKDGSGVMGPQIYPSEYLGRHLGDPHRAGSVELTLTLMNFGTSQRVSTPPPDQVTAGIR